MSAAQGTLTRGRLRVRAVPVRDAMAVGVLAAIVLIAATVAFDAASAPSGALRWTYGGRPFPGWLAGPFADLGGHLSNARFLGDMIALWALWVGACALGTTIRLRWAVAAIVLLHVLMALAPPIGLSDVFNYAGYGRLAHHGLNPYSHHIQEIANDPVFTYATWPEWTNPYGPLTTLGFYPLGLLSVPQALWVMKMVVAAASLACVWLVALCARELGRPVVPAIVFVGLNPQLLVYTVGGAHLDVFIVLFSLLGVLAMLHTRGTLAGAAVAAAAAVKASGGLLLPFLVIGARRRRDPLFGALVAGGVLYGAGLIAWGPDLLKGISKQGNVISLRSVPGLIAQQVFGATRGTAAIGTVGASIFIVIAVLLIARVWRGADWLTTAGWATVALLLTLTWLMPWYIIWLLPLAALSRSTALRRTTCAVAVVLIALRAPTAAVLFN
jgi:alpha-1,6-mannosyltransferase